MSQGAPVGNQNAVKAKRWQKALERALARLSNSDTDAGLDKVADQVVSSAVGGDVQAWKEIGDRMDGKATQALEHSGDSEKPIVHRIERVIVDGPKA